MDSALAVGATATVAAVTADPVFKPQLGAEASGDLVGDDGLPSSRRRAPPHPIFAPPPIPLPLLAPSNGGRRWIRCSWGGKSCGSRRRSGQFARRGAS